MTNYLINAKFKDNVDTDYSLHYEVHTLKDAIIKFAETYATVLDKYDEEMVDFSIKIKWKKDADQHIGKNKQSA